MKRISTVFAVLVLVAAACGDSTSEGADDVSDTTESVAESGDSADSTATGDTPIPDTSAAETTAPEAAAVTDPPATTEPPSAGDEPAPSTTGAPDTSVAPSTTKGAPAPAAGTPQGSASPTYPAGQIDKGLQPFIAMAIEDLAPRLGADPAAITAVTAVLVTWPDTSLGCPRPDMSYAQVLQDGSVIELEHDGRYYRYHSGGDRFPFLCDQPLTNPPPPIG